MPVRVASRRPIARIPLAKTILVAALMMAGLVVGAFLCIFEFAFYNSGGSWTPLGGLGHRNRRMVRLGDCFFPAES